MNNDGGTPINTLSSIYWCFWVNTDLCLISVASQSLSVIEMLICATGHFRQSVWRPWSRCMELRRHPICPVMRQLAVWWRQLVQKDQEWQSEFPKSPFSRCQRLDWQDVGCGSIEAHHNSRNQVSYIVHFVALLLRSIAIAEKKLDWQDVGFWRNKTHPHHSNNVSCATCFEHNIHKIETTLAWMLLVDPLKRIKSPQLWAGGTQSECQEQKSKNVRNLQRSRTRIRN